MNHSRLFLATALVVLLSSQASAQITVDFAENGPFDGLTVGSTVDLGTDPQFGLGVDFNLRSTVGRSPFTGAGTSNTPLNVNAAGLGVAQSNSSSDARFQDNQGWDGEEMVFDFDVYGLDGNRAKFDGTILLEEFSFADMMNDGTEKFFLESTAFADRADAYSQIFGNDTNNAIAFDAANNRFIFSNYSGSNDVTFSLLDPSNSANIPVRIDDGDDLKLSIFDDDGDASFGASASFTGFKIHAVPEPASIGLVSAGILGFAVYRRRKRAAKDQPNEA
ncbi:MAG: PEP-CTERM sorting domain-containing protein [Planctomycetota bacterium]|nr:PEP-CTERM sorting domain-containing protein [Planctomycetota bacterium]